MEWIQYKPSIHWLFGTNKKHDDNDCIIDAIGSKDITVGSINYLYQEGTVSKKSEIKKKIPW